MAPRAAASRTCSILGFGLCALLAPIVAHAAALPDGVDERAWIAGLTGLHEFAARVAGDDVYRSFGLITPLVYLLLLLGLRISQAPGTRLLRSVLAVAGVADALAYALPADIRSAPGTVEFFGLPLLIVGVGVAAWGRRDDRSWAIVVALCIPLAFVTTALFDYWPHGPLLGIAVACCLLVWASPARLVAGRGRSHPAS